jgi:hypothetical protein
VIRVFRGQFHCRVFRVIRGLAVVSRGTSAAVAGYQSGRDDLSAGLFSITDDIASFAWNMPRLQALHKSLSDEMSREVADVYAGDLSVIRA